MQGLSPSNRSLHSPFFPCPAHLCGSPVQVLHYCPPFQTPRTDVAASVPFLCPACLAAASLASFFAYMCARPPSCRCISLQPSSPLSTASPSSHGHLAPFPTFTSSIPAPFPSPMLIYANSASCPTLTPLSTQTCPALAFHTRSHGPFCSTTDCLFNIVLRRRSMSVSMS